MSFSIPMSLSRSPQSFTASAPDARADGGIRHIQMSSRSIRIERQVAGIKMHLVVPVHGYEGVVLDFAEDSDQRLCRIALVHRDPEFTVELHQSADSPSVLAIWRNWADFFAKPALYRDMAGAGQRPLAGFARPRPRRRGQALGKRRPHFLKRRRCGGFGPG